MKHGISYRPPDTKAYSDLCQVAEATGFDMLFIPDSQSLYREVYVSSAICAIQTEKIHFGPCVTNPLTRHPAVAASAMGTLSELSNNRAIFGIATGDSAVLNLGLKPSKVDEVRNYLTVFQNLVENGHGKYQDNLCHLSWFKKKIPTYIAAEGPRTLKLAGEIADGVIIGTGLIPEVISDTLTWIEDGAKKSGRTLDQLDLWWLVDVHIDKDGEKARNEIRTALASSAHHSFSFTTDRKRIPKDLLSAIKNLRNQYKTSEHGLINKSNNAELVDTFGLRDYLLERFAIAGTPKECRNRLIELEKRGVKALRINCNIPDRTSFMKQWQEDIRVV